MCRGVRRGRGGGRHKFARCRAQFIPFHTHTAQTNYCSRAKKRKESLKTCTCRSLQRDLTPPVLRPGMFDGRQSPLGAAAASPRCRDSPPPHLARPSLRVCGRVTNARHIWGDGSRSCRGSSQRKRGLRGHPAVTPAYPEPTSPSGGETPATCALPPPPPPHLLGSCVCRSVRLGVLIRAWVQKCLRASENLCVCV